MMSSKLAAACFAIALALPGLAGGQTFTLRYTTVADPTGSPSVTFQGTIVATPDAFTGPGFGIPQAYLPSTINGTRGGVDVADNDPTYFYNNFSEFYYPATTGSVQSLGGASTYLDGSFATLTYDIAGTDYMLSRNNSTFYLEFSGGIGRQILASDFSITQDVAPPAGVPEPATWAMMLTGFAATGYAVRRGRATIARPSSA